MELDPVEGKLDYAGEEPGSLVAAPSCMVEAPNCIMTVSNDTVEEQSFTVVVLDPLGVEVVYTVVVVEGDQAIPFSPP